MVEHDPEAKLLAEAEDGEDVISSVAVVVNDATSLETFDERFQFEVAGRTFRDVRIGELPLIFAGRGELLSNNRRRLAPRAGERRIALGVGAVGHLQADKRVPGGIALEQFLNRVDPAELDVDRLPGDEEPGAGHDVERCQAAGAGLAEPGVAGVDRVEDPHVGLHWGA